MRGGINLVSQLDASERTRGLITASTGNHGQSIAYAARLFGVPATICVPEGANPLKLAAIRAQGATSSSTGATATRPARSVPGWRPVTGSVRPLRQRPHLMPALQFATIEMLEEEPGLDVIVVPVGGGSGAAGACIVAKAIRPQITVIGVQSSAAPAAQRSWSGRELLEDRMETFAEGLATRVAFELPQRIMWTCSTTSSSATTSCAAPPCA